MGFFANHNVDDIPDDPNALPNNTYHFQVTSAELKPTKDGSKTGITFKYQIISGPWSNFFPLTDWVQVPDEKTPADKIERMLSYLKMRLLAFNFTPDEIQEFDKANVPDTIRREFYGTTNLKKDGNNTQIRVVRFDPVGDGVNTDVDFPEDVM